MSAAARICPHCSTEQVEAAEVFSRTEIDDALTERRAEGGPLRVTKEEAKAILATTNSLHRDPPLGIEGVMKATFGLKLHGPARWLELVLTVVALPMLALAFLNAVLMILGFSRFVDEDLKHYVPPVLAVLLWVRALLVAPSWVPVLTVSMVAWGIRGDLRSGASSTSQF